MSRLRLLQRTAVGIVLTAPILALLPSPANAIGRYDSVTMSCASIRSTIRAEGAVIMRWPSSQSASRTLYDRFVANERFCGPNEDTEWKSIPAADSRQCRLFRCAPQKQRRFFFR